MSEDIASRAGREQGGVSDAQFGPQRLEASARTRLVARLGVSLVTAVVVLAADQLTKWLAEIYLTRVPDQSVSIVGELFRLTYVENRGAAFGILQDQTLFFVVVGVVVVGVILASYRYFPVASLLLNVALGLQLGGAIGNLVDRVRNGYVVDFLDVGIWPVFNLADSSIVVGVAILAWHLMRAERAGDRG